ncbi:hypothetical protein [Streptomyces sp. NPDC002644]
MSDSRDDRIETYYQWGAREMAERIVDLEDSLKNTIEARDFHAARWEEWSRIAFKLEQEEKELQDRENFLFALEAAGVDNWEGYSTAYQLYNGEITEDEL